jgi:hypothetical protein
MKNEIVKFDTTNKTNFNASLILRKSIWAVMVMILAMSFQSCEQDDLDPMNQPESILPQSFRVEIPSSISSNMTVKSSQVDTLRGNDIYEHLRNFIHIGEFGAELTEEVIKMISRNNLSRPLELTYISDDDNRTKHLKIIENPSFESDKWQYGLTVTDVDASSNEVNNGIALQVFWNNSPVKGIAMINPYNINRTPEEEYMYTNFRIDYSEAGEAGYERQMIVAITGFPMPSPLVAPYALSKMKMFVGKNDDVISIYGNSEHPNARFFTNETGFNWAFVAAASESNNVSVAEVGLPPMNLDATDRNTLLNMYSVREVFTHQITNVWPGIDQEILDAYLYHTSAPAYFNAQGFVQGNVAPSDEYEPLQEKIENLTPYNPSHILGLEINFVAP